MKNILIKGITLGVSSFFIMRRQKTLINRAFLLLAYRGLREIGRRFPKFSFLKEI